MVERYPRFDGLEITYLKEVPTSDISEVLDELSNDFFAYTIRRINFGIAAGGLTPEVGVAFVLGAAASAFVAELARDIYRGFRACLFRLYNSIRIGSLARGRIWPMSVSFGSVFFLFEEGLPESQFYQALLQIPKAEEEFRADAAKFVAREYPTFVVGYDANQNRWIPKWDLMGIESDGR